MDKQHSKNTFIVEYLNKLGFDEDSSRLYFILAKHGPMSILQASRTANIERTKLYRIVEELVKKGLIEEVLEYKRKFLKAADINSIKLLVDQQKKQAEELDKNFVNFTQTMQHISQDAPNTQVLFYRGKEGIKQMLWNELNAKTESLCYVYKIFDSFIGPTFFDHWAEEFEKRNLSSREIRTEIFDQSYEEYPNEICFHMKNIQIRYLDSKVFPLNHGMSIYNDVLAIYNWWHDEVFGVEIYNKQIADFQRFVFEGFWKIAGPEEGHHKHKKKIVSY